MFKTQDYMDNYIKLRNNLRRSRTEKVTVTTILTLYFLFALFGFFKIYSIIANIILWNFSFNINEKIPHVLPAIIFALMFNAERKKEIPKSIDQISLKKKPYNYIKLLVAIFFIYWTFHTYIIEKMAITKKEIEKDKIEKTYDLQKMCKYHLQELIFGNDNSPEFDSNEMGEIFYTMKISDLAKEDFFLKFYLSNDNPEGDSAGNTYRVIIQNRIYTITPWKNN